MASVNLEVDPALQSITLTPIPDHTSSDGPFAIQASASSGLPVVCSVTSGPAAIASNTVALTGVGPIAIQYDQSGSNDFTAGPSVTASFQVTLGVPIISGVTNAAPYASGTVAMNSVASLFGQSFSAAADSGDGMILMIQDSSGTQAEAVVYYIGFGQIDFIVPTGLQPGGATVVLKGAQGQSAPFAVNLAGEAPALFSADASGKSAAAGYATIVNPDGSQSTLSIAQCTETPVACSTTPIPLVSGTQVYLVLFGTGIRGRSSLANMQVTIGGLAATVLYADSQGEYDGLDQVNVLVPLSLVGAGQVNVNLTADGLAANTVQVQF